MRAIAASSAPAPVATSTAKITPARRRMIDEARPLDGGERGEGREAGELDPPGAIARQGAHAAALRPGAVRSPAPVIG